MHNYMTKKTFEATCFALDDEGKGMVSYDGTTYFVPNLLIDEKAIIETVYTYGKPKEVTLKKRLSTSPERVKPKCEYFPKCGGCSLAHLEYESQLAYKRLKVQNLLKKFAKIEVEVNPTVGIGKPYGFRNKVQKPVRCGKKKGSIEVGFFSENSHDLVPIKKCLIEDEMATEITNTVVQLLEKYRAQPYDEDTGQGVLRHLLIKTSLAYREAMVCFVTAQDVFPGLKNLAREIVEKLPFVKTVIQNINPRQTNVILGEKERVVYGTGKIKDRIFDLDFLISSKSFYQTNSRQIEKLYGIAIDGLNLQGDEVLLDAYCGTGTIGLCAARKVKQVVGVELVKEAVRDARNNAKINNIENAMFIAADCTDFILNQDVLFDIVIMDPPRKGSTPEFLNALVSLAPKKIAYISCNPVTLARDLKFLIKDYNIDSVTPVDLFPHSGHVECVCLMTRKEK